MEIDSSLLSSLIWWNTSQEMGNSDSQSTSPWWSDDSSGNSSGTDLFSLSSEFSAIRQQYQLLSQSIQTKLGLQELNQTVQDKADALQTDLMAAFEEAGIDIGEGVNLTMDEDGIVRVFGQHENKEAIEDFFMNSEEWSERYASFHLYSDIAHKLGQFQSTSSNPYTQNKMTKESTVLTIGSDDSAKIQYL